jgi:hypothetical protein
MAMHERDDLNQPAQSAMPVLVVMVIIVLVVTMLMVMMLVVVIMTVVAMWRRVHMLGASLMHRDILILLGMQASAALARRRCPACDDLQPNTPWVNVTFN